MLCLKFPYPPKDGGNIAMLNMIDAFDRLGHDLTVLAMNTPKHYFNLRDLPVEWGEKAEYYAVEANTTPNLIDALANLLFSQKAYHIERFTLKSFDRQLEILLRNHHYDVIQLETLYLTPYLDTIREYAPRAVVVLRAHNIEHEIWRRKAENESTSLWRSLHRFYYQKTAQRLKAYETSFIKNAKKNQIDAVIPVTYRDMDIFKKMKCSVPVQFSNIGVEIERLNKWEEKHLGETAKNPIVTEHPSVFYIGAMDWMPNQEGINWFLKRVWPIIHNRYPEVKFYLAGRNMNLDYRTLDAPNLETVGEVEDAYAFMTSKSIMVVPLFSGSGMRVKIVEGMVLGKAIVATTIAAEGIDAKHGRELFLADDPDAFADAVSVLIEKRGTVEAIGANARSFARRRFDNQKIAERILSFYEGAVAKKQPKEKSEK